MSSVKPDRARQKIRALGVGATSGLTRRDRQAVSSVPVNKDTSNQRRYNSGVSGVATSSMAWACSSAPMLSSLSTRARKNDPGAAPSNGGLAALIASITIRSCSAGSVSVSSAASSAPKTAPSLLDHRSSGNPITAGENNPNARGAGPPKVCTETDGVVAVSATGASLASGVRVAWVPRSGAAATTRGCSTLSDSQSMADRGASSLACAQSGAALVSKMLRTAPKRIIRRRPT